MAELFFQHTGQIFLKYYWVDLSKNGYSMAGPYREVEKAFKTWKYNH